MQHFLTSLLTGLTTVFAWVPATILLIMPFIGIYTGLVYIEKMDTLRLLVLCLIAAMALAGYISLSSICWGLKLKNSLKVLFLIAGFIALAGSIIIGYMSDNTLLHVRFTLEGIYIFYCPLFFLLLHIVLESNKWLESKRNN